MNPDPEFMKNFVPGVFRYEREAAIAERAVEAYRFYLRSKVEAMEHADTCGWWIRNQVSMHQEPDYCDCWRAAVLNLLKEPE